MSETLGLTNWADNEAGESIIARKKELVYDGTREGYLAAKISQIMEFEAKRPGVYTKTIAGLRAHKTC